MTPDEGAAFWRGPLASTFPAVPPLRRFSITDDWDMSGGTGGGISRNFDGSVDVELDRSLATYPVLLHEVGHAVEGTRSPHERAAFMSLRGFPSWEAQADRQRAEQRMEPPRFAPNGTRLVWHISPNEKYAEGFRRAAQFAGLAPFDQSFHGRDLDLTEDYGRTFPHAAALEYFQALRSDDMAKFISGALQVSTDANGNATLVVAVSDLAPGVPAFGVWQRIGLTGTEDAGNPEGFPEATFQVDDSAVWGRLYVRGDPVKNGTAFYRVAAFQ